MDTIDKIRIIIIMLAFIGIGGFLVFQGTRITISANSEPVDLFAEDTDWKELKNYQHVYGDISFVWDYYLSQTEKSKYSTTEKETSRRYLVPKIEDRDGNGMLYMTQFLGITVGSQDFQKYDTMCDQSFEWWKSDGDASDLKTTPIAVDGYLRKMTSKERELIYEYFKDEFTQSEMDNMIVPYIIMNETGNNNIVLLVIGGIMILAGIVLFVIYFVKRN